MNNEPTFQTIESDDLATANGGEQLPQNRPQNPLNPWDPIARPGGTGPFNPFPRPSPTFPFPTGPVGIPGGNGPFAGTNEPSRIP